MATITFLKVSDNKQKTHRLSEALHEQYHLGKKILIRVANAAVANFVDELLWKEPKNSFLPHAVKSAPTPERVVITNKQDNLNQAEILVNLTHYPVKDYKVYEKIIELYDTSAPDKELNSREKQQAYETHGLSIHLDDR